MLGATERDGTVGRITVENLLTGGYAGRLYSVNPGYASVCGVPCFPSLAALPSPVEHVILTVGDARVEDALDGVIAHGARAATIMSSLVLAATASRRSRSGSRRRFARPGSWSAAPTAWASTTSTRECGPAASARATTARNGNVAYISHSGSGMCGIVDTDERIGFNLVVSTGQELAVAMDDYLDFALELPTTRVIGLFMETARNPQGLVRALEKARTRRIPIVALKVGRTELAAKLAVSHSGAIAGEDAGYQALFERYGVQRVDDMDQLATALIMFAQPHATGAGGLVSLHDSGGERQLLIDLAHDAGVPLTRVSPATTARLESLLDPGLPAVNPLDAWSTGGPDYHVGMQQCFAALMADPDAALGAVVHDRISGGLIQDSYIDYLRIGHAASGKPAFLVANRQGTGADPLVVAATREGFPVLDGMASFLRGVKCLLDFRDFGARAATPAPRLPDAALAAARARLASGSNPDEHEALALLHDLGLPANRSRIAASALEARNAARELGFPVVMKTAVSGMEHKTDHDGVCLSLRDETAVAAAWQDLAARLGPRVLVAPMVTAPGIEMLLGMFRDQQFGPIVVLGFGGVHVEALADVVYALPPFDAAEARRLVDRLKLRALLDDARHGRAPAIDEFCRAAARFSAVVDGLGDIVGEIDLNPVIVHADGCIDRRCADRWPRKRRRGSA